MIMKIVTADSGRTRCARPSGYFREIASSKFDGVACDFMEPGEDVFSVVTYRQTTYRWSFIEIWP
jgi:hypothetical protein